MKRLLTIILIPFSITAFAQNVGIGTTAPLTKLNVKSAGYGFIHSDATDNVQVGTYVDGTGGWIGTKSNHNLHFFTNNSNQLMTLSTTGQLGIGTTAPAYLLDVNGRMRLRHNTFSSGLWFNKSNNTEGAFLGMVNDSTIGFWGNTTSGSYKTVIDVKNGLMGINNTDPQATLDVNGTLKLSGGNPANGKVLTSDALGNATWSDAVGFMAYNSSGTTVNIPGGGGLIIPFNTENFDQSPNSFGYTTANGTYSVPVSGLYSITTSVAIQATVPDQVVELYIQVPGIPVDYRAYGIFSNSVTNKLSISNSINLSLTAGQTIRVGVSNNSISPISVVTQAPGVTSYITFFSAVLIK